jgi:hypothetical protein
LVNFGVFWGGSSGWLVWVAVTLGRIPCQDPGSLHHGILEHGILSPINLQATRYFLDILEYILTCKLGSPTLPDLFALLSFPRELPQFTLVLEARPPLQPLSYACLFRRYTRRARNDPLSSMLDGGRHRIRGGVG